MGKTRSTNLQTIRLICTITDNINTKLTFRMLYCSVCLSFGNTEALRKQLEMVNQVFHAKLPLLARGGCHFMIFCYDSTWIRTQPFNTLLNDSRRLAHFS